MWPSPQSWNEKSHFWVFSVTPGGSERGPRWLWLPGMFSSFVRELSEQHSQGWLRGKPSPASTAGHCVLPSQLWWCCSCSETGSQEMQGLSWKQGNHLGSQWGLGEFDLCSKSKLVFTAFIICIACTNYLVVLRLCTRQKWGILLPKKRARK